MPSSGDKANSSHVESFTMLNLDTFKEGRWMMVLGGKFSRNDLSRLESALYFPMHMHMQPKKSMSCEQSYVIKYANQKFKILQAVQFGETPPERQAPGDNNPHISTHSLLQGRLQSKSMFSVYYRKLSKSHDTYKIESTDL